MIAQPERANAYPEAQVSGELTLRDGCLFVGPNLVVWPYGATWDDTEEAVTFNSPPFDQAPAARVGGYFDGGGAYYSADTDFTSWFGKQFGASIEDCQAATNTSDVVYAYPSMQH